MAAPTTPAPVRTPVVDEGSWRYPGWRIVFACFLMAVLSWGFGFYGHAFYLAELRRLHGWPASLVAGATTAYYLFGALLVAFVSDAIRRLGARTCVLVGAICFAGSTGALPFVTEPRQLFAAYLLMAFGWASMSLGAITSVLGLWFDRKRGLAISLALNGASLGGVVVVPALVLLAGAGGFTTAMLVGAAAILAVSGLIAFRLLGASPPLSHRASGDGAQSAAPSWTRMGALKSLHFWSVAAPFALALLSQVGFLVHQIAYLEPTIGRTNVGVAVAITTAMAIVGRLALGTIAERMNQRLAIALSLLSQAAALVVMMNTTEVNKIYAACALYGLSVGNLITLPALVIQREFEAASFGTLIGLSTAIAQVTYAFGPAVVGLVRDATGGYATALALCIAINLLAAALVIRRPAS
jgi:MFS family permease